ncbi:MULTISPECIES: hypothetical protein [Methylosinus]|uniref:Prevent-host-death protein n=1 Tax=Methylosinus trichosporium (strain ATCC 35070 / NCIMB 11131 / UNIQEM 75 / OB3b) TaxID=595536 RepID=A0A2D2CXW3_METT3|nr:MULTISPECIES: hypothetical protein [Methylosinus]ATQ67592.1 prevent-host-death protein [Methylosinus trichosporium OB3b]OBS52134.1 hypothetical protein A8B73_12535 [Methylosinus sp. 3S-1]
MPITTQSIHEFNQDTSRAKRAVARGPVSITDREATHGRMTLAEALAQPEAPDFNFAPPRAEGLFRKPDLL